MPVYAGKRSIRFLLDTNICIYREDSRVVPDSLSEFLRAASEVNARILIHPISLTELGKDHDNARREMVLSKVAGYEQLTEPPAVTPEYLMIVYGSSDATPVNDDMILASVARNAVDFLVTEDLGIHRKARALELGTRVIFTEEARNLLRELKKRGKIPRPPALKQIPMYNVNLSDSFFDYFKEKYFDFEKWFSEKSAEGRTCFVFWEQDAHIGAMLVLNIEDEAVDCEPPLPKRRRIKICLMRVESTGYKLGERFIAMAVELAVRNDIDEIYLTHFTEPEDRFVQQLLSEYGFARSALNKKYGDDVYWKTLIPDANALKSIPPGEIGRRFYPSFFDGSNTRKFIVPIAPQYHQRLFIDSRSRQTILDEHSGEFLPEGNTIKKAYLCRAKTRQIRAGDILLFYRSSDARQLTSLGVVESVRYGLTDSVEVLAMVAKRTVYTEREIELMVRKPTTVILFRHHFHLPLPIKLNQLTSIGILKGAPQSIVEIADAQYRRVLRDGGIDARYTVSSTFD